MISMILEILWQRRTFMKNASCGGIRMMILLKIQKVVLNQCVFCICCRWPLFYLQTECIWAWVNESSWWMSECFVCALSLVIVLFLNFMSVFHFALKQMVMIILCAHNPWCENTLCYRKAPYKWRRRKNTRETKTANETEKKTERKKRREKKVLNARKQQNV